MAISGGNQKPKGKVGGARKGAGRKPGLVTQLKRMALKEAEGEAELSLAKLVDLRDNAKTEGLQFAAAVEIMNRVWGKPVQGIRGVGADGKDAPLVIVYEQAQNPAGPGH